MLKGVRTAWVVMVLFLAAFLMPAAYIATTSAPAFAGISADGSFTVTKAANKYTVQSGGEQVTYTYTITNTSGKPLYYKSIKDNKCASVKNVSGLTRTQRDNQYFWYIPEDGTAVWQCTQKVTQDTTNTVTVEMAKTLTYTYRYTYNYGYYYNYYSYYYYLTDVVTATDTKTVVVTSPPGGFKCDDIWYSGDDTIRDSTRIYGSLGTVLPGTGTTNWQAWIYTQTGNNDELRGAAAVAVDPLNPQYVYFSPRKSLIKSYPGYGTAAWVYRYDVINKTSTLLNQNDSNSVDISTVRLAADPKGVLWTINSSGRLYRLDPRAPAPRTWQDWGEIVLPQTDTFNFSHTDLESGDIAFDGIGTLYYITANRLAGQEKGYLLTISADALKTKGATGPAAKLVGKMGDLGFNGIAFDSHGNAYTSSEQHIHSLNISTGKASTGVKFSGAEISDLSSCALPKPELRITKVAPQDKLIKPGSNVTWTILVENIGTLAATNVTFQDTVGKGITDENGTPVPDRNVTNVSTKLNGNTLSDSNHFDTPKLIKSPDKNGNTVHDGVIAPGDKATIEITTTVPDNYVSLGSKLKLCNQAKTTLTGVEGELKTDDPNTATALDPTCVTVSNPPVTIAVTTDKPCLPDNKNTVTPIGFTINVHNPSTEWVDNVVVAGLPCTAAKTGDDGNNDTRLDPGETWTYTCTNDASQKSTYTAQVTGTSRTGVSVNESASVTVDSPGLTITKTASTQHGGDIVQPGEEITYTLTVKNDGVERDTQQGVTLIDTLPEGLTYEQVLQRTYWIDGAGGREPKTDSPTISMGAGRKLDFFADSTLPGGLTNGDITLEPYDESKDENQREQITVRFKVKANATFDLTTITSLTNTAVATPKVTAEQCPVEGTATNTLGSKFTVLKKGYACTGAAPCEKTGSSFELYGADPASPNPSSPNMGALITNGVTPASAPGGVNSALFNSAKLPFGRYWLVETTAPQGHGLLAAPIVFDLGLATDGKTTVTPVDGASHSGVVEVIPAATAAALPQIVVTDTAVPRLPQAGGPGPLLVAAAGAALFLAGRLIWKRKFPINTDKFANAQKD